MDGYIFRSAIDDCLPVCRPDEEGIVMKVFLHSRFGQRVVAQEENMIHFDVIELIFVRGQGAHEQQWGGRVSADVYPIAGTNDAHCFFTGYDFLYICGEPVHVSVSHCLEMWIEGHG